MVLDENQENFIASKLALKENTKERDLGLRKIYPEQNHRNARKN